MTRTKTCSKGHNNCIQMKIHKQLSKNYYFVMGKIKKHPHHVYITIPKPRSSKYISVNSRLKDKLKTI